MDIYTYMAATKNKRKREQEIGKIYGCLQIIDFIETITVDKKKFPAKAIVKCLDCNSEPYEIIASSIFRKDHPTISCGCVGEEYRKIKFPNGKTRKNAIKREQEIGKTYGFLYVIDFIESKQINKKQFQAKAVVKCLRCGSEPFEIVAYSLRRPRRPTVSCGCLFKDRAKESTTKHGLYKHPLYQTATGAISRCSPNSFERKYYYERGIRCYWSIKNISEFIDYLETLPPKLPNQSLDRIDNNKCYEPGNLRWATAEEQVNNRRTVSELQEKINKLNTEVDVLKKENEELKSLLFGMIVI